MEKGALCWIKSKTSKWATATVSSRETASDGSQKITAVSATGEESSFQIKLGEDEIDELKLRNPPTEDDMENLIDLLHLNEPEILFYLE
eukprot:gene44106-58825_t